MTNTIKLSLLRGIAFLVLPVAAQAQSVEARWRPWIGCWAPVLAYDTAGRAFGSTARVCIAPAPGSSAAEVTTIYAGKVTNRIIIEANAEPHAVTRDGCEGTETAWWSRTGQRLYLRSALTCADGTRRSSSGVLSFTEHRQWLDVRGLAINGGSSSIAVGRFAATEAADSVSIPAEVRHATPVRTPSADHAAVAAASPITLADIAEVSTNLEESVASAWLVERARGLTLAIDGKKLAALADHGVPSAVIDVAVALAYPDVFGIASDSREAQRRPGVRTVASQSQRRGWYQGMPTYSSSCNPYFLSLDPWYYYGSYARQCGYGYPYGYYGYGYGFGSPYGWYGPYSGTYYSGGPMVVVIQNPSTSPGHGRVVKGQGYTSGAGANGSAARSSGSYTSMTSGHGSISAGSGASSSASGGTSSSSSSSGGERTAVRKP